MDLCKDLSLSIVKEDDPKESGRERITVRLTSPLEMLSVEESQQIHVTTLQSRRYHIMEATILVLRRVVSEAFRQGMISDSLGEWKISRPPAGVEVELNDSIS
jgi:cyanate lyase